MNRTFLQSSSIHKKLSSKIQTLPLFLPSTTRITDISINYTTSNIQKDSQQLQACKVFTARSFFPGELEGALITF